MPSRHAPTTERKVPAGRNRAWLTPDFPANNSHPALPATIKDALPEATILQQNVLAKSALPWHYLSRRIDGFGLGSEVGESE